jgi:hypothetical protein
VHVGVVRSVNPLGILAVKALAGGVGVVVFALIGEVVRPKKFAGLFAAAPSLALAGLLVTVLDRGPSAAAQAALGMAAGGAGMVVFCVVAAWTIPRLRATRGSLVAMVGWGGTAAIAYLAFLR